MAVRMWVLFFWLFHFAAAAGAGESVRVEVSTLGPAYVVEARMDVPVAAGIAWGVLTDFDHMASILNNLDSSRVIQRDGNRLVIRQTGVARYGPISHAFEIEREIRLVPTHHIHARNLSGSLKRMESDLWLNAAAATQVHIAYHAEFEFDSLLAKLFGAPFLQHEIEEQFRLMVAEMQRRATHAREALQPVSLPAQP